MPGQCNSWQPSIVARSPRENCLAEHVGLLGFGSHHSQLNRAKRRECMGKRKWAQP
ncbi:hypothetical protein ACQ4M4_07850 [Leptolyngbya sp. AN02str]|uniref:hypothetical protein n=1 Tax=Leptolyngbya sp. AN02str TaxID=3423363 RepID=UPI003D31F9FE